MKIEFEWQVIWCADVFATWRAKVYGGWLIRDFKIGGSHFTLTFIPDEHHRWEIDNEHQDI